MITTLIYRFYGSQAEFFLNAKKPKIIHIKKLDRERMAVEIIIEAEEEC